jgi:hypothetical protein
MNTTVGICERQDQRVTVMVVVMMVMKLSHFTNISVCLYHLLFDL